MVEGTGAEAEAHLTNFTDCGGDSVAAIKGGHAVIVDCECTNSYYSGMYARGFGSSVEARGCTLRNNSNQGACAARGGTVEVFNSWVSLPRHARANGHSTRTRTRTCTHAHAHIPFMREGKTRTYAQAYKHAEEMRMFECARACICRSDCVCARTRVRTNTCSIRTQ